MNALLIFFVLAVLVEALVQNTLGNVPQAAAYKPYAALVVSVALCLVYGADIMPQLGLPEVAYVGPILTGILISRGANVFNDIVDRVRSPMPEPDPWSMRDGA